jgi:WD40 repeat protein
MIAVETSFYVTGGTLEPNAPCYVERKADGDLFARLSQGEFCYVLTPRQMGKSSLMARTAARLRREGTAVVLLELTALGQNLTAEQWYDGLLGIISQQLALEEDLEEFWLAHERLSPLQRWQRALREVVLARRPGRVVICIDEIDSVRSLPFSTDEFFAAIRECYNRRSEDLAFHRLTFCLLGVATPSDLIQDSRTTPFNIGRRIELTDFTEAEAAPLAWGLNGATGARRREAVGAPREVWSGDGRAAALLRRVLYWTGGHPYLTQRLCEAVAAEVSAIPSTCHPFSPTGLVDRLCAGLFLSHGARERDDNLLFVREWLLKSESAYLPEGELRASLLDLYGKVRAGKRVIPDDTNPLIDILRLSGITRVREAHSLSPNARPSMPTLAVRNRIYARVFDRAWVAANMPDAELRRQRAAFRKGLLRSAGVASALIAVIGVLALSALRERDRTARLLYVADMNVARQDVYEGNLERAEELLNDHRPGRAGGEELRGFEWRYLWRLCQQDALYTFQESAGPSYCVAYSRDGRTLVSQSGDGTVTRWDATTRERISSIRIRLEMRGIHTRAVFSPDLNIVAALTLARPQTADGGTTHRPGTDPRTYWVAGVWDLAAKRELASFASSPTGSLAISPDGRLLAAAGWNELSNPNIQRIKIWDLATQREVATPVPRSRHLASLAFSPDGKTLAWVDGYQTVELWNIAAKRTEARLPIAAGDWALAVAFSPDGEMLAIRNQDETVRLWDRAAGRVTATLRGPRASGSPRLPASLEVVCPIAFSPDGKKLAMSRGDDPNVTLWDLVRKKKSTLRGHKKGVTTLAFAPGGKSLATGSADGTVKLWSAAPTGEGLAVGAPGSATLSVAFAPDAKTMAIGDASGDVTLWSVDSSRRLATLKGHREAVRSVAFSRDGRMVASGGDDRTIRLWDPILRRELGALPGTQERVWSLAFCPTGTTLASGGEDRTVRLWDVATRQQSGTLQTDAGVVMSLSFSPDGRRLALGTNEYSVKLWDVARKQELDSLLAHSSSITATTFSPDGKVLATGGKDRTIVLWDVAAGERLWTLKGGSDWIHSLAFSPDGRTLASGSSDAVVRLWNVATGREVGLLRGARGPVYCVAFSPDGNALAAGGKDGAVRLWRAPPFAETDAPPPATGPLPALR